MSIPDSARPGAIRPETDTQPKRPPQPADEVLQVPPLIDRPLDVDEGPTVKIERFELVGVVERPEHDIHPEQIRSLLQDKKAEYPQGLTIGQLDQIAEVVTQYYRDRGLILAQAVIPVQTVEEGVVKVKVLEGRIGRILTEGNDSYSKETLARPFKPLLGKPVVKSEVEAALLTLTDFPGLSVFGVFQPGQKVGEADIVLKVQEEDRADFAVRFDNQGTQETGRNRGRFTFDWNNPTGSADRLTLTVQKAIDPTNTEFGSVDYERYLGNGFRGGVFLTKNAFDVGGDFAAREISASTESQGVFVDKQLIRSRKHNLSAKLQLTRKNSITEQQDQQINEDNLTVVSLEATYDSVDTRFAGLNFATLEISRGFNDLFGAQSSSLRSLSLPPSKRPSRRGGLPDQRFAEGQFNKIFGAYSRLQTLTRHTSLLLRTEFQWSEDLLVALEQYSIGGPDNVRSYGPADALYDQAAFASLEYIINAPFFADTAAFANRTWGELLQLSLFYDGAIGRNNDPLVTEPTEFVSYQGVGWQLRFNWPNRIESRLMMAWPVGAREPTNERTPQVWADFTYRF